jgi:hypothetical protein
MFNIFALMEMQIKTTMRLHLTPVRMARKEATANEYVGGEELIYICGVGLQTREATMEISKEGHQKK